VEIEPSSNWCLILRNDIMNNKNGQTPQIFDNGDQTIFNLGANGNHWDDWTSPDTDSNGIVDVPYGISGAASNQDEHPSTIRFTNHSYWNFEGSEPNSPYIIKEIPEDAVVDEMYTVYFNAVDRDTPIYDLSWGVDTNAEWLEMDGSILKGRPSVNDVGSYIVRVWVTDGTSNDEFIFDLEVLIDPYGNGDNEYPPSILTQHDHKTVSGLHYSQSYTATDPDTDTEDLEWSVTTNAGFLTMEDNILRGTPSNSDIGAFTVSVLVFDGEFWDISSFTLVVYPPEADDDIHEPELIDIEERSISETGEVVLSVKDLTDGMVSFIEFEWYIDGVMKGSNSSLVVDLAHGVHIIFLRARALGNDWYEVTKEVQVNGVPDNKRDVDKAAVVIVSLIMIIIVMISVYLAFSRKRRRSYSDAIQHEDKRRIERSLEREGSAGKRGPHQEGPQSHIEEEFDLISREALTWKRPSRFTMERNKMHTKLRMKLEEGSIDDELHRELEEFIDNYFPEGKD
jgi:hypothetical protein